jgi:hypothetical protein
MYTHFDTTTAVLVVVSSEEEKIENIFQIVIKTGALFFLCKMAVHTRVFTEVTFWNSAEHGM